MRTTRYPKLVDDDDEVDGDYSDIDIQTNWQLDKLAIRLNGNQTKWHVVDEVNVRLSGHSTKWKLVQVVLDLLVLD